MVGGDASRLEVIFEHLMLFLLSFMIKQTQPVFAALFAAP
jgi:hypothetical protein